MLADIEGAVEQLPFWEGYWKFAEWYLIALAAVFLIAALFMRRPGAGFGILLFGVYVTLSWYFMTVYDTLGYSQEWALGIVIGSGLALGALFYYFIFVRTG